MKKLIKLTRSTSPGTAGEWHVGPLPDSQSGQAQTNGMRPGRLSPGGGSFLSSSSDTKGHVT